MHSAIPARTRSGFVHRRTAEAESIGMTWRTGRVSDAAADGRVPEGTHAVVTTIAVTAAALKRIIWTS